MIFYIVEQALLGLSLLRLLNRIRTSNIFFSLSENKCLSETRFRDKFNAAVLLTFTTFRAGNTETIMRKSVNLSLRSDWDI